jgi:hypothetical protein
MAYDSLGIDRIRSEVELRRAQAAQQQASADRMRQLSQMEQYKPMDMGTEIEMDEMQGVMSPAELMAQDPELTPESAQAQHDWLKDQQAQYLTDNPRMIREYGIQGVLNPSTGRVEQRRILRGLKPLNQPVDMLGRKKTEAEIGLTNAQAAKMMSEADKFRAEATGANRKPTAAESATSGLIRNALVSNPKLLPEDVSFAENDIDTTQAVKQVVDDAKQQATIINAKLKTLHPLENANEIEAMSNQLASLNAKKNDVIANIVKTNMAGKQSDVSDFTKSFSENMAGFKNLQDNMARQEDQLAAEKMLTMFNKLSPKEQVELMKKMQGGSAHATTPPPVDNGAAATKQDVKSSTPTTGWRRVTGAPGVTITERQK